MRKSARIDYGLGQTNVDRATGIRFGVIPAHEVGQAWFDDSETWYGKPVCPECGSEAVEYDEERHGEYEYEPHESCDYACEECERVFGSESAYPEEPISFYYDSGDTQAEQSGDDPDIFITKSPYYTWAAFCSPCAPGAGYLLDVRDEETGVRAYCFGHDWFEGGKAPYPVYWVGTGELIEPEVAA